MEVEVAFQVVEARVADVGAVEETESEGVLDSCDVMLDVVWGKIQVDQREEGD